MITYKIKRREVLTMAKITMDFRKIKAEDMKKFIEENHAEDKKAFKEVAYVSRKPVAYVQKVDAQGNPIYKISKKTGKKYIVREAVAVSGEETKSFNLLRAKQWFYEKYNTEIDFENVPMKKDTVKTRKTDDLFKDW